MDRNEREKAIADQRLWNESEKRRAEQKKAFENARVSEAEKMQMIVKATKCAAKKAEARAAGRWGTERGISRSVILARRADICESVLDRYSDACKELATGKAPTAAEKLEAAAVSLGDKLKKLLPMLGDIEAKCLAIRHGKLKQKIAITDAQSAASSASKQKGDAARELYRLGELTASELHGSNMPAAWKEFLKSGDE